MDDLKKNTDMSLSLFVYFYLGISTLYG